MRKYLKLLALAVGATVASGVGCLIPQDIEPMNELLPVNRPPAFDLENFHPSEPVVRINTTCAGLDFQTEFWADIFELDLDQELRALWFWNYDAAADQDRLTFLDDRRVAPTGTVRRILEPFRLPEHVDSQQNQEGVHTLEVFVVEDQALVRGPGSRKPYYRNLRKCEEEGYPDDCISTHPAVMRWTVQNIAEGSCP